jgi:hypothetical protein
MVRKTAGKPKRAATLPPKSGPAHIPRNVALELMP